MLYSFWFSRIYLLENKYEKCILNPILLKAMKPSFSCRYTTKNEINENVSKGFYPVEALANVMKKTNF